MGPSVRRLCLFAVIVYGTFVTPCLFAQNTTVIGTVRDANGVAYGGASLKAQLVLAGAGVTGQATVTVNNAQQCRSAGQGSAPCQVPFQGTAGPLTLSSTGTFTVSLPDNTLVTPSGTQWLFTITSLGAPPPLGTGPQVCISQQTISGATQNVVLQFCPALSNIAAAGGVPQLTGQFNVKDFGAVGDAKFSRAASYTQVGSTITDNTNNPFLISDVGKFITCSYAPNGQALPINTANGIAQITGLVSSSTVSIAPNLFINGIGTVSNQDCVWYTQDDSAAFCCAAGSAYAAAHTAVSGSLFGPSGPSITTSAPRTAITCSGGFAVGGAILTELETISGTLGVSLQGTGCFIYVLPSITTQLISSVNTSTFLINGLDICGLNFVNTTVTGSLIQLSTPQNFWMNDNRVTQWSNALGSCSTNSNALVEVDNSAGPSLISKNVFQGATGSGCGFRCIGCGGYPTLDNNYIGNNIGGNMFLTNGLGRNTGSGALVVRNHLGDECGLPGGTTNAANACVQLTNQTVMFEGGVLFGPGSSLSLDPTSEADLYGMNVGAFSSVANINAIIGANGSKVVATNSTLRGNGTGTAFVGPGSGSMTFQDLGGNVMQNCTNTNTCTTATTAQTFQGNVNTTFPLTPTATTQLGGSQTVSGNAPTACTVTGNGTSTCAFDTGSTNAAWTVTITAAGTTTATGTVQFTLNPSMGTNSTSCTANYTNGGTGAWSASAISPIFTTNTTTTVAFNINNAGTNLTAASTYKISGNCYGK